MPTLYEIYQQQGKALPGTVESRFADPSFAQAAQQAGITKDQYRINAGNADYNTRIANLYGKAPTPTAPTGTPKADTPVAPVAPVAPALQGISYQESADDKALREARDQAASYYKEQSGTVIDEDQIRRDALAQMQAEIDAQNALYADKLRRAQVQGTGRLGTATAIGGRRGLLGSDFGESQYQNVEGANQEIYSSIENEKQAVINALLTKAKESGAAAIAAKRAAKEAGVTEYVNALKSSADASKARAGDLAKQILLSKLGIEQYDPAALEQAAQSAGVSVDEIKRQYKEQKSAFDIAEEERKAKLALDTSKAQPASYQEYLLTDATPTPEEYNAYQTLDANRKASIARAGAGNPGGLTPYQQFQATQAIAKDTQARTEGAREMARQAQLIDQSYNNIVKGGDRSLNTQAIITSFNKILDPSSVVRESEYDRTAEGQSLLAQLEGKVQNIASGGAGVTDATLKEAANIAKLYLDGARKSIEAQNKRAQAMAAQFGLNPDFVVGTYQDNTAGGVGGDIIDNDPLGLGI